VAKPKLRLFGVKNVRTGALVKKDGEPVFFNSKPAAKTKRDDMIDDSGGEAYAVVLGPDHYRYRKES
jgi:hypothetical protein